MEKNILALNVGEEVLIKDFGIIRCVESIKECSACCLYKDCVKYNNYKPVPCYSSLRKHLKLDNKNVIYIRVTAINKNKINKV